MLWNIYQNDIRRVITSYLSINADGHQKYKTAGVPEIANANLMRNANKGTPSGMLLGERGGIVLPEKSDEGLQLASHNRYSNYDQNLRFSLPYLCINN